MKTKIYIDISPRQASQNVIDKLKRAYPDESGERYFQCDLFENDPRLKRVWEILLENGLAPRDQLKQNEIPFCFEMERVYNASELRAATYLTPWARNEFDVEYRDEQKRILLNRQHVKRNRQAGFATMSMIVSLALKQKLERAGFLNLVFLPVCLDEKPTDQWWEMTSEIRLPPVAPPCEVLYFRGGKPIHVTGDTRRRFEGKYWELASIKPMPPLSPQCQWHDGLGGPVLPGQTGYLTEAPYFPAEYHYRHSDLALMEPFDLARTHEEFGDKGWWYVASRRFREVCQKYRLPMDWWPVRIDLDSETT